MRAAGAGDLQAVADMVSRLAEHHGDVATVTVSQLERDLLGPQPWVCVLVAEEAEAFVGYAALCPLSKLQFGQRGMDLQHLYVAREARRRGVARALIEASVGHAQMLGCSYMSVGTHPDNVVAQGIYAAMGFDQLDPPGPRFRITFDADG